MGDIVNLRTHRRQRARKQDAQQAADNRSRFGRTPAQIARDEADAARGKALLDGARIDPDPVATGE
ncbi:DUF4169 family protein [Lichenicola cladoniae]|uniref:DUF4169 family protein n=1 Tax=Lichenicola cladoniae TaxID=1484109 RepID=A0A6M8HQR3_9PROT|nr:DUF4169 family protein [Lichenicola cladoniae]NPD68121.1 DUF4169 family protein [Acetobacteraceae bacterium]QKE90692.1 DUF4169 family protein [Lichenicola cladoniae]